MGDILRRSDVQGTSVKRRTVSPAGDPLRRLSQAPARADDTDAAVKGLTGQAHEGHYFRVTESYLLTFPICTTATSQDLLLVRYNMFEQARSGPG
jgi:trehalose/maltose hydrolase-like predicted phosphorylase